MTTQGKFILFENVSEFSAWLSSQNINRKVTHIQLHCTDIPSYKDFTGTNHFRLASSMESAHLKRGFAEIAQNVTIFPDGKIMVCRNFAKAPACISGHNTGGLCIENVGLFDVGKDTMKANQRFSIVGTVKVLLSKLSLNAETDVVYHSWHTNQKTCPGTNFFGGNTRQDFEKNLLPLLKGEGASAGITNNLPAVTSTKNKKHNLFAFSGIGLMLLLGAGFMYFSDKK